MTGTGGLQRVPKSIVEEFQIPLPPLEVQHQIVAEIEGYQKIIDGARQVLDNYQPRFAVNPNWPKVKIGELVSINNGYVLTDMPKVGEIACVKVSDMNLEANQSEIVTSSHWLDSTNKVLLALNSVVFPKRGAAIATNKKRITKIPCLIDNNCMALSVLPESKLDPTYLFLFFLSFDLSTISNSAGIALINNGDVQGVKIPLPDLTTQRAIVAEVEAEQALVAANRELIRRMEAKVKAAIDRVWGTGAKQA